MENAEATATNPPATTSKPIILKEIDPIKEQAFLEKIKEEQSLIKGLVGGIIAAGLGAIIWALVTVITDYQIGWMAVLNGFLVGFAMRKLGKGIDKKFGIVGAALALVSCLLGNLLMAAIILGKQESISLLAVLLSYVLAPKIMFDILAAIFSPIDLLFYGIALYEGYRLSIRKITKAEYEGLLREKVVYM